MKTRRVLCLECNIPVETSSPNFKRCEDCRLKHIKQYTKTYHKAWYGKRAEDSDFLSSRIEYSRNYRKENIEKRLLLGARTRSKELKIDFNIDLEDIVVPELCPILNVPMVLKTRHAPSLDRVDPNKGYVKGNVWVISRKANVMKNDATSEELRSFSEWINRSQV